MLAACTGPERNRPDFSLPLAGAEGGSSGSGGTGGAGGAGGPPSELPPDASGTGGGEPALMDAGSAGEQPIGQPALFDELVGTDPGRNDVAGNEVCERLATIQCAGEASCCAAPAGTFEDCKRSAKQGCVDQFLDAIMANSIAGYDRVRASAVFGEYERLARQCDVNVVAWGASSEGFRAIARGTIGPGAKCQPSLEHLVRPGAIAAAHLVACASPETHACLPRRELEWACAPHAAEGGACFMDMNCSDGLFCTNSEAQDIEGGTCTARKAEAAPCGFDSECLSFACLDGACAPTTRQTIYCSH